MPLILRRPTVVAPDPGATLWVHGVFGDDSRSKATVAASGGSLPWATIGRAAWGSTNRSSPNAAEAADAGDTVSIAAGTYTYTGTVDDQKVPVYNPANAGTSDVNRLVFRADGDVRLVAVSANSPVAGVNGRDYVSWTASAGGRWLVTCDGRGGITVDTKTGDVVNTRPDTGPCVAWSSTGTVFERWDIDGGPQLDYTDNWDGIRAEESPNTTIRNCTIYSFRNLDNTGNGTCIKFYGCPDSIAEHNTLSDAGSGFALKDSAGVVFNTNQGIRIRYNKVTCDRSVAYSMTSEGRNYIYQNLFLGGQIGMFVTGGGFTNDWIYNNTFAGFRDGGFGCAFYFASASGSGGRFWGNIFYDCDIVIALNGFTMPADTIVDFEHNVYFSYTNFYNGSDGNRTLASFNAAYTDQNAASPVSVNSDPLFVNAGAGDYRVQAGSPAENLSVDIDDLDGDASTVDTITAGCFVTGSETMGVV